MSFSSLMHIYRKWWGQRNVSRSFDGLDQWGVARLHNIKQIIFACWLYQRHFSCLRGRTEFHSLNWPHKKCTALVWRVIVMYIVHIISKEYVRQSSHYVKVCTCILLYHNPHHYLFHIVVQSTAISVLCTFCQSLCLNETSKTFGW